MKLSVVVITKNEGKNIGPCLKSASFADELIVVDSGSSDGTVDIARDHGAIVYKNEFKDFSTQKNFGIDRAGGEWVLSLDADERVGRELASEIRSVLPHTKLSGYYVKKRNNIFGRFLEFGSNRNDFQLLLARKGSAVFEGAVHQHMKIAGPTAYLKKGVIEHYSTQTLSEYMRKLNYYTDMEIEGDQKRGLVPYPERMRRRPLLLFVYRWVVQMGFRDGVEGLIFSVLSAYYEFIRLAKGWEAAQKNER